MNLAMTFRTLCGFIKLMANPARCRGCCKKPAQIGSLGRSLQALKLMSAVQLIVNLIVTNLGSGVVLWGWWKSQLRTAGKSLR